MIEPHSPRPGKIVTFYSYKGGTGRSMALANVAWLLALHGKRVLAIDWDLEAPGLHRYLSPFLDDPELSESDGILDFVIRLAESAALSEASSEDLTADYFEQRADILSYVKPLEFDDFPGDGCLHLIGAGRQDASYSRRLSLFNFVQFYERLNGRRYLEATKKWMRAEYDYILLDSRTGVSDTSGICTIQMPDALVICTTLNEQNIRGSAAVAADVRRLRAKEEEDGSFRIYPVPMRVELSEQDRRQIALDLVRTTFNTYLVDLKTEEKKNQYWGQMQVVYIPYYAFEEIPAVFGNNPNEDISMLASTRRIAGCISGIDDPPKIDEDKRKQYLDRFLRKTQDLVSLARRLWEQASPVDRDLQKRLWLRFVQVGDGRIPDSLRSISSFDLRGAEIELLTTLCDKRLVKVQAGSHAKVYKPIIEDLIQRWDLLRTWIEEDRAFLAWRQETDASAVAWQGSQTDKSRLLTGERLRAAVEWRQSRQPDLSPSLALYILKSWEADPVAIAESLFGRLPEKVARQVLLRFVNTAGQVSSQTVVPADIPSEEEQAVLTQLLDGGLVKNVNDEFELVYPNLVTEWDRYRTWIEADKEFLSFVAEIQVFANAWQRAGLDDARLLTGEALTECLRWQPRLEEAPARVRRFLQASIDADVVTRAERAYRSLPKDQLLAAKMLLLRLVALDSDGEFATSQAADEDLTDPEKELVKLFRKEKVLRARRLELSDPRLLTDWKPLREWCQQNAEFLEWRTRFETRATGPKPSAVLNREEVRDWDLHIGARAVETSASLRRLVARSRKSISSLKTVLMVAAPLIVLAVALLLAWLILKQKDTSAGPDILHATPLAIGQPVQGSLTTAQPSHFYEIKTPKPPRDMFAVQLSDVESGWVPQVTVYDASKSEIQRTRATYQGENVRLVWSPSAGSTYYVQVGGNNAQGSYKLSVTPLKRFDRYEPNDTLLQATSVKLPVALDANVMDSVDVDAYQFQTGVSPAQIHVSLENRSATLTPVVTAFGPDKARVTSKAAPTPGANIDLDFRTEANTTYYVLIGGAGTAGDYTLKIK